MCPACHSLEWDAFAEASTPKELARGGRLERAPGVEHLHAVGELGQGIECLLGIGPIGFDRQLRKTTAMSVTYTGARGYHQFRSRDVNAPTPPLYLLRPDPSYVVVRQVESTGRQDTDSMQVTLRGRVTRWFNGQMQYTLNRADNDTNGINAFPANDPPPTVSSETSRGKRTSIRSRSRCLAPWAASTFRRSHSILVAAAAFSKPSDNRAMAFAMLRASSMVRYSVSALSRRQSNGFVRLRRR
jgi:hypothetical protein